MKSKLSSHATSITCLLVIGFLVYNSFAPKPGRSVIHPVESPSRIQIWRDSTPAASFEKGEHGWQMTAPRQAPARQSIIDTLLATNRYSQRSYLAGDVALTDASQATLVIDGYRFDFAGIEPVSGLRYVLTQDRVYLQPDHVAGIIGASISSLIDTEIER